MFNVGEIEVLCVEDSLLYPCHFAGPHVGRIAETAGGFAYLPGRG